MDDDVYHAKTVYRLFASNATLNDVLSMLEAKSEDFVTATDLHKSCLIETFNLWQLQV
jgi:hypothetical protein